MELRDVNTLERKSAQVEDFFEVIKEIHQEFKSRLQKTTKKYKEREDKTSRDFRRRHGDGTLESRKAT